MQARGYVSLERPSEGSKTKVFIPSEQGELTDAKLQEFFKDIINVSYTAGMEHHLDEIAAGKRNNIEEVRTFYMNLNHYWKIAYEHMEKKELERTGETCPECGSELVYRIGRYGKDLYPVLIFLLVVTRKVKIEEENTESEEVCPNVVVRMVMKKDAMVLSWHVAITRIVKYIKSNKPNGGTCTNR